MGLQVPGFTLLGDVLWRLSHLAKEVSLLKLPLSTEGLAFVKSPFYVVDFEPITQATRLAWGYQQPFPGAPHSLADLPRGESA